MIQNPQVCKLHNASALYSSHLISFQCILSRKVTAGVKTKHSILAPSCHKPRELRGYIHSRHKSGQEKSRPHSSSQPRFIALPLGEKQIVHLPVL